MSNATQRRILVGLFLMVAVTGPAIAQPGGAGEGPPASLQIRSEFRGLAFYESTPEDCPDASTNGTAVLTAELRLVSVDTDGASYEGTGRYAVDLDGCGLTPNREDPGQTMNGTGFGGFHGDNFLGCTVSVSVPEHDVRVTLEVDMQDPETPNYVEVEWEPTAPPATVEVGSACEAAWHTEHVANLTEEYSDGGRRVVSGYDLVPEMVGPGAVPREGVYRDPDEPEWTLTIGTGPPVRVAIEGPACGCLDAEDAEGELLRFTATASEPGGTFTAFTVRPDGLSPRVARNEGGATPRLELVAGRETGSVTLSVSYEHNGRRYTSAPFPVSFCTLAPVEVEGGTRDLAFDAAEPGRLVVTVSSTAWLDGADISASLRWRLEEMPAPTRLAPGEATGAEVSLAYEGLPTRNRAFGEKTVTVRAEAGACACERQTTVRTFFHPVTANHPPGDGGTGADRTGAPNWFYYWLQTRAAAGVDVSRVHYQATLPPVNRADDNVTARYVEDTDRLLMSDAVVERGGCRGRIDRTSRAPAGGTARGIDCFAETLRHEWQHRTDWLAWWPDGYGITSDPDLDGVPNAVEEAEPGCSVVSSRSCDARPFPDVTDREINAYYVGWTWGIGGEDASDWACGGKQWGGGVCPE